MRIIKYFFNLLKGWIILILQFVATFFKTSTAKNIEIIQLRSQLALYQEQVKNKKRPKPKSSAVFRQLWVLLSKLDKKWRNNFVVFSPKTVKRWHKTAFKFKWRSISKKRGRPTLGEEMIDLIKEIHQLNPLFSPAKIRETLISMNVQNPPSENTIKKYLQYDKRPPSIRQTQSWKTFLKNHSKNIWAMDFFTVPTLFFNVLYVFIIISHGRRKIEHFGITTNPNQDWVKQQIRYATPFDHKPKYLIHDNEPVFVCDGVQDFLKSSNIKSVKISKGSPWQNGIAERAIGILRQELLDYIIPFNEKHLHTLLNEFVNDYYNTHRTHQGINGETPIPLPWYPPTTASKTRLIATPVLGGLYHTFKKIA